MKLNEKVVCADGFTMSVQAHAGAYCLPRMTGAPVYREVEVGFPSDREELLMHWAEESNRPTDTVYGWVPVAVVTNVIAKHGGIVSGEVPRGVIPLESS
tara:strand:+ start:206 stop:502 length:297 start_codon:yes stop_codon:yes gene_type:complete